MVLFSFVNICSPLDVLPRAGLKIRIGTNLELEVISTENVPIVSLISIDILMLIFSL